MEQFKQVEGRDLPSKGSCYRASVNNVGFSSSVKERYRYMEFPHFSCTKHGFQEAGLG